jgi:hypothetical protein
MGQRAVGEVVEWPLSERRLVDRVEHEHRFRLGIGQTRVTGDQHRVVRRRDDAADDRDLAVAQRLRASSRDRSRIATD